MTDWIFDKTQNLTLIEANSDRPLFSWVDRKPSFFFLFFFPLIPHFFFFFVLFSFVKIVLWFRVSQWEASNFSVSRLGISLTFGFDPLKSCNQISPPARRLSSSLVNKFEYRWCAAIKGKGNFFNYLLDIAFVCKFSIIAFCSIFFFSSFCFHIQLFLSSYVHSSSFIFLHWVVNRTSIYSLLTQE